MPGLLRLVNGKTGFQSTLYCANTLACGRGAEDEIRQE